MNWLKKNWRDLGAAALMAAMVLIIIGVSISVYRDIRNTRLTSQAAPAPVVQVGDVQGPIRDRVREKVLLGVIRSHAIRQMERQGFALVGGNKTPLSREQAEKLYDRLADDVVIGCVQEGSPDTFGKLGDGQTLAKMLKWIVDHKAEILEVLKLVLSILALFADTPPTELAVAHGWMFAPF